MSPLLLAGLGLGGVAAGFGARHILDDTFENGDSENGSTFCGTNAPWDATTSKCEVDLSQYTLSSSTITCGSGTSLNTVTNECVSNVDITSDNEDAYQKGVNSVVENGSTFCGTNAPWDATTSKCEVDLSQYTLSSSTITCGSGTSLNTVTNECVSNVDITSDNEDAYDDAYDKGVAYCATFFLYNTTASWNSTTSNCEVSLPTDESQVIRSYEEYVASRA